MVRKSGVDLEFIEKLIYSSLPVTAYRKPIFELTVRPWLTGYRKAYPAQSTYRLPQGAQEVTINMPDLRKLLNLKIDHTPWDSNGWPGVGVPTYGLTSDAAVNAVLDSLYLLCFM